ncbi:MAG: aromatic amino acid lyase, partial [candidate division Zixibacteria bacterium]|nr:aromatic amino acid lyase [candidate division Zixibacteria bacterium]
ERHTNRLLNPALSGGLPDFLVEGKGLNSGLMVSQYSAAALVSENKILAHPAVVDSISVSADQEDHVPMAMTSALKLVDIIRNTQIVIAVELMCAAQALDFKKPLKPGKGTRAAYDFIRQRLSFLKNDRPLHKDIRSIESIVVDGSLVDAVESATGRIDI